MASQAGLPGGGGRKSRRPGLPRRRIEALLLAVHSDLARRSWPGGLLQRIALVGGPAAHGGGGGGGRLAGRRGAGPTWPDAARMVGTHAAHAVERGFSHRL